VICADNNSIEMWTEMNNAITNRENYNNQCHYKQNVLAEAF